MSTVKAKGLRGRTVNLVFCSLAGLLFLLACSIGGNTVLGVVCLGIMLAFGGVAYLLAGRNETASGMFDRRDERWAAIDLRATALSGVVLILVIVAMAMWELAHGRSGVPYTNLGAIAGIAYLVIFLGLKRRG
jgi:drug/metabolite transporter (DMT)-like permease